ncbi:hypothetical protein KWH04_01795 [Xanthomonas campestris pv. trichodesmae]|uniref:hypothetical protein n=1 Tax=Lysobacteraceae TaxID=32033 RepID=UPI0012FE0892|nr:MULTISPECIES: hypothetical protein [Xanthomonadaceae]MBV6779402.1 hypothetical protein [Xanthomonas campestris pv. trichodesmae]
MSNLFNLVGGWGESVIKTEIMRPINVAAFKGYPRFPFMPIFLGEKAETFDFIVYLLGLDERAAGPYFFLQVKSTETVSGKKSCPAPVSREDVTRAVAFKSPSFVVAADLTPVPAKLYIRGISNNRTSGISSINKKSDLSIDAVKVSVYDEVAKFHSKRSGKFISKVK